MKTFVRAHDVDHGLNLEKAGATAVSCPLHKNQKKKKKLPGYQFFGRNKWRYHSTFTHVSRKLVGCPRDLGTKPTVSSCCSCSGKLLFFFFFSKCSGKLLDRLFGAFSKFLQRKHRSPTATPLLYYDCNLVGALTCFLSCFVMAILIKIKLDII